MYFEGVHFKNVPPKIILSRKRVISQWNITDSILESVRFLQQGIFQEYAHFEGVRSPRELYISSLRKISLRMSQLGESSTGRSHLRNVYFLSELQAFSERVYPVRGFPLRRSLV